MVHIPQLQGIERVTATYQKVARKYMMMAPQVLHLSFLRRTLQDGF